MKLELFAMKKLTVCWAYLMRPSKDHYLVVMDFGSKRAELDGKSSDDSYPYLEWTFELYLETKQKVVVRLTPETRAEKKFVRESMDVVETMKHSGWISIFPEKFHDVTQKKFVDTKGVHRPYGERYVDVYGNNQSRRRNRA